MKYLLFPLFLVCIFTNAFAQTDSLKQFLNYDKKPDSNNMSPQYYRVAYKNNNLWTVDDYYVKQQTTAMSGSYLDDSLTQEHGSFVWFYKNKSVKEVGRYIYGKKDGLWKEYYEDGKIKDSAYYKNGLHTYLAFYYDSTGFLWRKGIYDKEGKGTGYEWRYFENGKIMYFGKYSEGYVKDSIWEYRDENGIVSMREYYDKANG